MRKIEDREEAKRRALVANRKAVAEYQKKFKRVNCRFEPGLYEEMMKNCKSANSFIIEAVTEKLERIQSV